MKWGKRNGPPYPLDGEDHSASEKKAGWRKSLDGGSESEKRKQTKKNNGFMQEMYNESYSNYKKMGYSNTEAKALAEKRQKIMKNCLIAAGVAGAVVIGGAIAYKVGTNYMDYVIKAGTTVQTLSKDPQRLQKGHLFYTNYVKLDKNIYEGSSFARTSRAFSPTGYKNKIQANVLQYMKIASGKNAQKVFNEAYSSPEAKKVFEEVRRHYAENPSSINSNLVRLMDRAESGDLFKYANSKTMYVSRPFQSKGKTLNYYEHFNRAIMPLDDPQAVKITKVFTDALEKKGYAGVIDINDTKVSNLRGIRPTIVTDKSKVDIMNSVAKEVTKADQDKLRGISSTGMLALNSLDEHPIIASLYASAVTLATGSYAAIAYDAKAELNSPNWKAKHQKRN